LSQLSQPSANPFRPGSGIFPPLLAGRERETAIFEGRIERTRHGQPEHTALLGDWAIGKTTLLMHWRRLQQASDDAVVLTMAYPQTVEQFLAELAIAIDAGLATDWSGQLDLEVGLDVGVADARLRRPARPRDHELRGSLRRLVDRRRSDDRTAIVVIDDIDLVTAPSNVLLQLRAAALELYARDVALALVVAASPSLFAEVRSAHEPLIRFFEPLTLGPLDSIAAARAINEPLAKTRTRFDAEVVAELVELSAGRPYYLQKLGYYAFDAATGGRVSMAEFSVAFEHAFASVSQEIFAGRWAAMSAVERRVVAVVAQSADARPSGEIEAEAARHGVRPAATRQALRRLVARGHVERLASGMRGRYTINDRLFRRYLELQECRR
jgi:AAA ATPase-like protein